MFNDCKYKLGDVVLYNNNRYRIKEVQGITSDLGWRYEYDLVLDRESREGELTIVRGVDERAISCLYEDKKKGKELLKFSKECIKYDRERPEFLPEYRNIPVGLKQSLNKVHDDMINSLLYSVPTFYMKKEEVNAMFGVPKFEYKKIIFNGPCTIILWKDGSKTIAKASNGEWFDPEKGVAICFMKKMLGHTETNKILRKANKDFYDEIAKKADKDLKEALTPMNEYLGAVGEKTIKSLGIMAYPLYGETIDASTIAEVKKVEEEKKMDFRSCLDCKYASKPVTDKPCSDCASKSRFEKGYEK